MAASARQGTQLPAIQGATSSTTRERWEAMDLLPYVDREYDDPAYRAQVNRLVTDEMKRSNKRPSDYLAALPPPPKVSSEANPMMARECERVRAGRPPAAIDTTRYQVPPPSSTTSKRGEGGAADSIPADLSQWKAALRNANTQLQHQSIRWENLELLQQFGANAWRVHNQHLQAFLARMERVVEKYKSDIEALNADRKLNQQMAASDLQRLEEQWRHLVSNNLQIEVACQELEGEVARLQQEAVEKGCDMGSQFEA